MKGGNIRESIPGVSRFRTNGPDGESCMFAMLGCVADEQAAYFHPSYGLFYINF